MTPEMLATLTEQVAELVQTYSNNYLQFQRARSIFQNGARSTL